MLEAIFSFRGRINRLQYFLGGVALMAVIVVGLLVVLGPIGVSGLRDPERLDPAQLMRSAGGMVVFALVGAPLFLWISLSLQARRWRDLGLEPLYMIPGLIAFHVLDRVIAAFVPALAFGPMGQQTLVGILVSFAAGIVLLFFPGRRDGGAGLTLERMSPRPSVEAPAAEFAGEAAPEPIRMNAPMAALSAPRATFGRRGL